MSLFDIVDFGPEDVQAVHSGEANRGQIIAILTSQTCGEPCWHAHEDICRCSCGGKNHGCLRTAGGVQPVRMTKLDGIPYKLGGVGKFSDLCAEANRINKEAGFSSVDKPMLVIDSCGVQSSDILADLAKARAEGRDAWVQQYRYTWNSTSGHSPARIKPATMSQVERWPELSAFRGCPKYDKPSLLWIRNEMPRRPAQLAVDRDGLPLADQNPERCD